MTAGDNLIAIALAHGLAIGIVIAATGHIPGDLSDPAVTVGLAITGRLTPVRTAVFIGSQLLGAVLAALALVAIFPSSQVDPVAVGVPAVGGNIDAPPALLAEIVLTVFLMYLIYGLAVDQRSRKAIAPLEIGLTITADIFAMGAVTGAAMNPARHFGPALVSGNPWGLGGKCPASGMSNEDRNGGIEEIPACNANCGLGVARSDRG